MKLFIPKLIDFSNIDNGAIGHTYLFLTREDARKKYPNEDIAEIEVNTNKVSNIMIDNIRKKIITFKDPEEKASKSKKHAKFDFF